MDRTLRSGAHVLTSCAAWPVTRVLAALVFQPRLLQKVFHRGVGLSAASAMKYVPLHDEARHLVLGQLFADVAGVEDGLDHVRVERHVSVLLAVDVQMLELDVRRYHDPRSHPALPASPSVSSG